MRRRPESLDIYVHSIRRRACAQLLTWSLLSSVPRSPLRSGGSSPSGSCSIMAPAFVSAFAPAALSSSPFVAPRERAAPPRRVRRVALRAVVRAAAGDEPIGVAVIGCGRIGQVHARTISQLNSASLVAVADPFEKFGRMVAEDFSTVWTPDWQDLLANDDVNGIVIGSPTPFHAEQIIKSAEAGKDIFCEKPISNDLATIDKCLAAVAANGVRLLIGFQRRFDSNFIKVREQVASGAIGQLRMFHITSRDPAPPPAQYLANSGGIFLDMSSHDWDMARFITGAEIESVYVTASAFEDAAKEANDVDTVITVLKMSDGSFGTIDNSRRCSYGYDQRIEVFGSKGTINSNNRAPDTVVVSNEHGLASGLPYSFFMDRYADAYSGAMTAFVNMIKEGTPAPCSGFDGRASIVAAMAAARSHSEGRLVRLEECDLLSKVL
ncbi:inositol 2-dehydrogenase [Gracilaria domingensis]|nr:inositol 2-dehydrogenase [Gracilaria domingensis]